MTTKSSFASVHLDVQPRASASAAVLDPEKPFRVLLMGDFSGRSPGSSDSAWRGQAIEIDRDNFEGVMARVAPGFAGMKFQELDDFHPDRIYQESLLFQALRDARRKLEKP